LVHERPMFDVQCNLSSKIIHLPKPMMGTLHTLQAHPLLLSASSTFHPRLSSSVHLIRGLSSVHFRPKSVFRVIVCYGSDAEC
uniref:Ovule protein n=1 Tax=Haemonchus placei TaxID=6290 RepID=A0A158QKL0_HAEPC